METIIMNCFATVSTAAFGTDDPVPSIFQSLHPSLSEESDNWQKWRYAAQGGRLFVDTFLKKFSTRETDTDFATRKAVSYCPAVAKSALMEIRNAIFRHMEEIKRVGGSDSWQRAIKGADRGVDLLGNSMNGFMGRFIIKELLAMRRVGVFIDKPPIPEGATKSVTDQIRPFLYYYTTENIRNWQYDDNMELKVLLLRDYDYDYNEHGLASSIVEKYRLLTRHDGYVSVQFFNKVGKEIAGSTKFLAIPEIPFVEFEINQSFLADIADHQVALLNMGSSDVQYVLLSGFPFYIEQVDSLQEFFHQRPPAPAGEDSDGVANIENTGDAADQILARDPALKVGVSHGRKYGRGLEAPSFIHPSSDPLMASLEKQKALKAEVLALANLAVRSTQGKHVDAQNKTTPEDRDLEAGLAAIGLELEYGENQIAQLWSKYEGISSDAIVTYPANYRVLTQKERTENVKAQRELLPTLPSLTFQKEMAKLIAETSIGHIVTNEGLEVIKREIDQAPIVVTDPEVISSDVEAGLVSAETASKARLYGPGEAKKAQVERAERVKQTMKQQQGAGARGVDDLDPHAKASAKADKEVSQSPDANKQPGKAVRGKGK